MVGSLLRVLLLVAWVGITGTYAVRHLGLGRAPAAEAAATFARNLDRTMVYELRWRPVPTAPWEAAGSSRSGARTDDTGLRVSTELVITNPRIVPGARYIRQFLGASGGPGGRELRLHFDQLLDSHMRLQGVEVEGSVFGVGFSASGPVDHAGLLLTWKAGGQGGSLRLPEVRPETVSGNEISAALPAGLRVGSSFSTRFASLDPAQLRLATKQAVYVVTARAPGPTAAGEVPLLEVEMRLDDRRVATLWCDDAGIVHRQELGDQGLRLDLVRIVDELGKQSWPPPAGAAP